jgi:hypothetical protein
MVNIIEKTKKNIKQLDKVVMEIIIYYMTHPLKCMLDTNEFVKGTKKDLKFEVYDILYNGESKLEEKLDMFKKITESY